MKDPLPEAKNLARVSLTALLLLSARLPRTLFGGQLVAFFSVTLEVGSRLLQSRTLHSKRLGSQSSRQSQPAPLQHLLQDPWLRLDVWHVSMTTMLSLQLSRQHPKLVIVRGACDGDAAWGPSALEVAGVAHLWM
ncbi:hypothetical protein MRX96_027015 [Rhipicephalus microplus]